jgi:hypothetical protein
MSTEQTRRLDRSTLARWSLTHRFFARLNASYAQTRKLRKTGVLDSTRGETDADATPKANTAMNAKTVVKPNAFRVAPLRVLISSRHPNPRRLGKSNGAPFGDVRQPRNHAGIAEGLC